MKNPCANFIIPRPLLLINCLFLGFTLAWLFLIPYNNAPDENTHFTFSVEFILNNHRLPICGVDDLDRFRHAISSYNQMPALNYIIAAVSAGILNALTGLEPFLGARMASLAWGLLFINSLFLALRALDVRPNMAAIATATVCFIPQVLFSFCYINSDAHSLAISALLTLALIRFLKAPADANIVFLGIAAGMLFSAKYNYFVYAPLIGVLFIYLLLRRQLTWQTMLKAVTAMFCGFVIISGFWYARNIWLFGAPIPQPLSAEYLAQFGIVREALPAKQGFSVTSFVWLARAKFIQTSFASFFGLFGYMEVGFPPFVYTMLGAGIILLTALFAVELARAQDRALYSAAAGMILLAAMVLALHIWTCLINDYQPQGRYLFAVLAPAACFIGWAINRQRRLLQYTAAWLAMLGLFLISAHLLIVRTYASPLVFASSWNTANKLESISAAGRFQRLEKNRFRVSWLPNNPSAITTLHLDFPKRILARYRDVTIKVTTTGGATTFRPNTLPELACSDMQADMQLNAFDVTGPDPFIIFRLPPNTPPVLSLQMDAALERRRLRDIRF